MMAKTAPGDSEETEMNSALHLFRPPVIRSATASALTTLDRSLFRKTVNLAAAAVADRKQIASWRRLLENECKILAVDRVSAVVAHPEETQAARGSMCILLDPEIKVGAPATWGPVVEAGVQRNEIGMVSYDLHLDYDYWLYEDVLRAILPLDLQEQSDGIPAGFNRAGHVAHLNLKEPFLPYKKLIGEVIIDKNASIRTVINKVAQVGIESEFRTFGYEVISGTDDLDVEVRESDCIFRFDYGKVYWNSKLDNEHRRLIETFRPGEVVCDVMAGVGPFAVPAGKNGVFVWANDYNPESYKYLQENIKRNKVGQFVRAFNEDGRIFIRNAADLVHRSSINGERAILVVNRKEMRHCDIDARSGKEVPAEPAPRQVPLPPTISHFVMNLPATAITFLPHFRGLYAGREELFAPHTTTKLPMIHVHCFAAKAKDDTPLNDVCGRISDELGVTIRPGDAEVSGEAAVLEVRAVAPNKRMFCASFRLPHEVAFAPRPRPR